MSALKINTQDPGCVGEWALSATSFDQVLLWDLDLPPPLPQKVDGVLNQRLLIMKKEEARDPKSFVIQISGGPAKL